MKEKRDIGTQRLAVDTYTCQTRPGKLLCRAATSVNGGIT